MKTIAYDHTQLSDAQSLELSGMTVENAKMLIETICEMSNLGKEFAKKVYECAVNSWLSVSEKYKSATHVIDNPLVNPGIVVHERCIGWELPADGIIVKLHQFDRVDAFNNWHITIQLCKGHRIPVYEYVKRLRHKCTLTIMLRNDTCMTLFPDSPADTPPKTTFTPTTDENSRLACAHLRNEMKRVSEVALNISRSTDTCPADIATDIHNLYQQIGRFLNV